MVLETIKETGQRHRGGLGARDWSFGGATTEFDVLDGLGVANAPKRFCSYPALPSQSAVGADLLTNARCAFKDGA